MRRKSSPQTVEARVNELALHQHVLTHADLLRLGLSRTAIARRLESGRLVQLHHGVYSIGGTPPTRERRWAAAVHACGPRAALSHLPAAALWEIRKQDPRVIDVTVRGRAMRRREGVRVHRPRQLRADELTVRHGIPVTTAARTLADCATMLGLRPIERMLDEAEYLGLMSRPEVREYVAYERSRGAARLRRILARHEPGSTRTRNRLEEGFLVLVRGAGLPEPRVNVPVGPYVVDFLWDRQRVAVETDGRRAHERASARERDYGRDAWLAARGYRCLRFTYGQVHHRPAEVLGALTAVLDA